MFDVILHDFSEQLAGGKGDEVDDEAGESEDEEVKSLSDRQNDEKREEGQKSIVAEEKIEEKGEKYEEGKEGKLRINYSRISSLLFGVGKRPTVTSRRRKRIYALCKKCVVLNQFLDI